MIYENVKPRIFGYRETYWSGWTGDSRQLDFWPKEVRTPEEARARIVELEAKLAEAFKGWIR